MECEVYHVKPYKVGFGSEPRPEWPENYEKVAIIECWEFGDSFRITNHIDHAWQENKEVIWARSNRERSTSVDDVVTWNGTAYRCEVSGWEDIS